MISGNVILDIASVVARKDKKEKVGFVCELH